MNNNNIVIPFYVWKVYVCQSENLRNSIYQLNIGLYEYITFKRYIHKKREAKKGSFLRTQKSASAQAIEKDLKYRVHSQPKTLNIFICLFVFFCFLGFYYCSTEPIDKKEGFLFLSLLLLYWFENCTGYAYGLWKKFGVYQFIGTKN